MKNLIFAFVILISCSPERDSLTIEDYSLFKKSELWELAKAVDNNDLQEIKERLDAGGLNLDLQEPKFGATLLMVAIVNEDYEACKYLLEGGASAEIHDTFSGATPLIYASEINSNPGNIEFIRILLKAGANPNTVEKGDRKKGNSIRYSP
ncbi:MAG TPA: ankyrin repeat domain-containing protein, partial [Chryseosolibacter sp.]|nr:ankyrin repeat domain-containing protein [Chryseosolibacter sp.]